MELCHILWPSDQVTRESSDPETQLTRWPCSYTRPFNGPLFGATRVSRYQKGKTNLDFTEAGDSEWQWHQLGHMQVGTSLQTDNHASTPPLSFYRPDALHVAQSTASKHWRSRPCSVMNSKCRLMCRVCRVRIEPFTARVLCRVSYRVLEYSTR